MSQDIKQVNAHSWSVTCCRPPLHKEKHHFGSLAAKSQSCKGKRSQLHIWGSLREIKDRQFCSLPIQRVKQSSNLLQQD